MNRLVLVIGNRNYSSWSLRPWLVMEQAGIPFTEIRIPLYAPGASQRLLEHSPSGKVPVLKHGALAVWDSLAICEYLAERFPDKGLWPHDLLTRAQARSISTEMHSGFSALRENMFMNIRRHMPGRGRTPAVEADIERIPSIWRGCRARYASAGPFLFGAFSIADAMYAPVALRFQTYAVTADGSAGEYAAHLLSLPAMKKWIAAAHAETERIDRYEPVDN